MRLCPAHSQQSEPWINSSTPTVSVVCPVTAPCRACSSMTGMAPLSVRTVTWWGDRKSKGFRRIVNTKMLCLKSAHECGWNVYKRLSLFDLDLNAPCVKCADQYRQLICYQPVSYLHPNWMSCSASVLQNSLSVCSRCGEKITDRVLKAVGQCFHAHCFRCSTCSCILEGAPFITDDNNNPYCVQDYHR